MSEVTSSNENKVQSVGQFLFILNNFRFVYDIEPNEHKVTIRGRIGFVEGPPIFNLCLYQTKSRKLQIIETRKAKIVMIVDLMQYTFEVFEIPKDWHISFEKGYLIINY
jgi:hypothetical protein